MIITKKNENQKSKQTLGIECYDSTLENHRKTIKEKVFKHHF